MNNTYYGGFRTRTFAQIYDTFDKFQTEFAATPFATAVATDKEEATINLQLLFYMLYARYGNSHIANSDENQFKYGLFNIIFMYGPAWATRLSAQKAIRELGIDEARKGRTETYNHAYNPSTAPTMNETDGLPYINDQNKTLYQKSILEGYASLLALVETDVSEDFINKFRKLFTKVAYGDEPLLYITQEDNTI